MNWEVLTTAPDQLIAESWCGLIRAAGIDCKLQPGDAVGWMGVSVFLAQKVLDAYVAPDEEPPDSESLPETQPDTALDPNE